MLSTQRPREEGNSAFFRFRRLNTTPEHFTASSRVISSVSESVSGVSTIMELAAHLGFRENSDMVLLRRRYCYISVAWSASKKTELDQLRRRYFNLGERIIIMAPSFERSELGFSLTKANLFLLASDMKAFREEIGNALRIIQESETLHDYFDLVDSLVREGKITQYH